MLSGSRQAYYHRYLEEQEAVAPILQGDPAFVEVELCERSNGGIYLVGTVPTADDMERLCEAIVRSIGEHRAREALDAVSVKK